MKRILITGGGGLLGSNIAFMGREFYDVFTLDINDKAFVEKCEFIKLDLTNEKRVKKTIDEIKPDSIFHTAALTDVDHCEDNYDEAKRVNVAATEYLVKASWESKTKFIYISTDSVFDGRHGMSTEEDTPNPLNNYAKTKYEGELIVQANLENFIIARTNIYGWNLQDKNSFSEWIFRGLMRKQRLTMFADIFFSPILINDLIEILFEICEKDVRGLFHIAGAERCSKYEFALKLANTFELDSQCIHPISVDDFPFKAERPKDTSLDVSKISKLIERSLPNVEQGIQRFKELLHSGYVDKLKGQSFYSQLIGEKLK